MTSAAFIPDQMSSQNVRSTYEAALRSYVSSGDEADLSSAYDCARLALAAGVSIGEISEIHFAATQGRAMTAARAEEFFLETISVYDMALRGYGESVAQLTGEVQERKRVELALRDVTAKLASQRDKLDQDVKARTRELEDRLEELRRANAQLQLSNREQAEFTYAISHDLKSPVSTVSMMLDLLDSNSMQDEGRELVDAARATILRMSTLIADIVAYSSLLGQAVDFEEVALTPLCQSVVLDLGAEIQAANATVEISDLCSVRGVPSQLRSLFHHVVSNAIKFRDPIRPCRIRIHSVPDPIGCSAEIIVQDNGIGIDPAYRDRIFALFQRLHTYQEYPGSGVGLTLCQRIVGYHCGDIRVSSAKGEGCSFTIRLWVKKVQG